jgi:adenylosuccinate lyase
MLALTQKGMSREAAYAAVQSAAMKVWRGEGAFLAFLKADPEVRAQLTDPELESLFDLAYHFKHVDTVFARVFGEQG